MKRILLLVLISLALNGCAQKSGNNGSTAIYDAKKIIDRYKLTKVDSLRRCEDCKGIIWHNKDNWASPALLVVRSLNGDTIFTHIGDKWQIRHFMPFKHGNDYFVSSNGSFNERPENFNSNMIMHVNPKSGTLDKINELNMDIFMRYISKRIDTSKTKILPIQWRFDEIKKQMILIYKITKDTLNGNIDYGIETPMLIEKSENTFNITAKPSSLKKQEPDPNDWNRNIITHNNPIGELKGIKLVYDCINCRSSYSEAVEIYAMKGTEKVLLINQPIADMFVTEVEAFSKDGGDFIYINSGHTYGHDQGYLYSLDLRDFVAHEVNVISSPDEKVPKDFYPYKYFNLQRNENGNFYSSNSFRSETNPEDVGSFKTNLKLLKVKDNVYMLDPQETNKY